MVNSEWAIGNRQYRSLLFTIDRSPLMKSLIELLQDKNATLCFALDKLLHSSSIENRKMKGASQR